jgi:hypothetical protein
MSRLNCAELKPINWTTKAILSPHKLEDEYNINCEAAATFGVVCTGTKPKIIHSITP